MSAHASSQRREATPVNPATPAEGRTLTLTYGLSLLKEIRRRLKRPALEPLTLEIVAALLEAMDVEGFLRGERMNDLDAFLQALPPLHQDLKHLQRTYGVRLRGICHREEAPIIQHALELMEFPAAVLRRHFEVLEITAGQDVLLEDSLGIVNCPAHQLGSIERDVQHGHVLHLSRHMTDAVRRMDATSSRTIREIKEPKLLRRVAGVIAHHCVDHSFRQHDARAEKALAMYRQNRSDVPAIQNDRFRLVVDPHLSFEQRLKEEMAVLAEDSRCWDFPGLSILMRVD